LKETTSIKIEKKDFEKIEGFLKLPDLGYNSRADFANKAIQEKIEKINSKLASQEDNRYFHHQIENLSKKVNKLEKQLKYFKEEYKMEEKILDDPEGFNKKTRRELEEVDPDLAKALDNVEEIHRKKQEERLSEYTPKERKEYEADMKRIGEKLRKERSERRKKLFKQS